MGTTEMKAHTEDNIIWAIMRMEKSKSQTDKSGVFAAYEGRTWEHWRRLILVESETQDVSTVRLLGTHGSVHCMKVVAACCE